MQKRNPSSRTIAQATNLTKISSTLSLISNPSRKGLKRAAHPRPTITTRNRSNPIVDVEPNKLSASRRSRDVARKQLENDTTTHGHELRCAPLAIRHHVCGGEMVIVVDDIKSCNHGCKIAVVNTAKINYASCSVSGLQTYKLKNSGPALGPSSMRFVVAFKYKEPMEAAYLFPGPAR